MVSLCGFDLAYPVEILETGLPKLITSDDLLRQAIKDRILTPVGSRFFHRSYGSRVRQLLNEPNAPVISAVVKEFIIEAIRQDSRVSFVSCAISYIDDVSVIEIIVRRKDSGALVQLQFESAFLTI